MDTHLKKTYFLPILLLFCSFAVKAQSPQASNEDKRSANRRFADSLYAVHNPKTLKSETSKSAEF